MTDTAAIRTVVGIIGNIISLSLFLSPASTIINIWKERSVQAYKPDPYIAILFNNFMWLFYGMPFVHPDSTLVITINSIGMVIEGSIITVFIMCSDWSKKRKIIIALVVEVVVMIVVIVVTMMFLHNTTDRSLLVGILCLLLNIGMYAAPLTVARRVIKTKSVKYMPFLLSLANLINGIVWSAYALLKIDPFVLVPNVLGTVSGVVQLTLYAKYYKTTNWDEDDSSHHPEVELQQP